MKNPANVLSLAIGLILSAGSLGVVEAADTTPDPIQTTSRECITPALPTPEEEGRRAFLRLDCYSCHGAHGHEGGMGPSLIGKAASVDVVYEGDGHGMPGYKNNLCPNDVANLGAYIAALGPDPKTDKAPDFTHWWESPPLR